MFRYSPPLIYSSHRVGEMYSAGCIVTLYYYDYSSTCYVMTRSSSRCCAGAPRSTFGSRKNAKFLRAFNGLTVMYKQCCSSARYGFRISLLCTRWRCGAVAISDDITVNDVFLFRFARFVLLYNIKRAFISSSRSVPGRDAVHNVAVQFAPHHPALSRYISPVPDLVKISALHRFLGALALSDFSLKFCPR